MEKRGRPRKKNKVDLGLGWQIFLVLLGLAFLIACIGVAIEKIGMQANAITEKVEAIAEQKCLLKVSGNLLTRENFTSIKPGTFLNQPIMENQTYPPFSAMGEIEMEVPCQALVNSQYRSYLFEYWLSFIPIR